MNRPGWLMWGDEAESLWPLWRGLVLGITAAATLGRWRAECQVSEKDKNIVRKSILTMDFFFRDKTMDDNSMYIHNDNKQNYPLVDYIICVKV